LGCTLFVGMKIFGNTVSMWIPVMTSGSGAPYADADESRRYRNEEVNILTVLPIPGDDLKGWDEFDLVFSMATTI